MFGSNKRKSRSEAYHKAVKDKLDSAAPEEVNYGKSQSYHDNIRALLHNSKPSGGYGYDVEELARQEQAVRLYEVRRHTDRRGRAL